MTLIDVTRAYVPALIVAKNAMTSESQIAGAGVWWLVLTRRHRAEPGRPPARAAAERGGESRAGAAGVPRGGVGRARYPVHPGQPAEPHGHRGERGEQAAGAGAERAAEDG